MSQNAANLLTSAYLVFLLLGGVLLGPAPEMWVLLSLLALQGWAFYRPFSASRSLGLLLLTLLLAPQGWTTVVAPALAPLLIVPALPAFSQALRVIAPQMEIPRFRQGRRGSTLLVALSISLLGAMLLGVFLGTAALLGTSALVTVFVLSLLAYAAVRSGRSPLASDEHLVRTLAGTQHAGTTQLRNQSALQQRASLGSQVPWLEISPTIHALDPGESSELALKVQPPLAGPARLGITITTQDPWGLLWTGVVETPIGLHVIPRARFAARLAQRYLEQTSTRSYLITTGTAKVVRGVEFSALRRYHPGDRMRDISWRATAKYRQPMVKEYLDPQSGSALLLVNLVGSDAEQTDRLAYLLITAALSAARRDIPIGFAAYDQQDVVFASRYLVPREAVKQALRLSERFTHSGEYTRILSAPDVEGLRRLARKMETNGSGDPQKAFGELLGIELASLEELAQAHPVTRALQKVRAQAAPPATLSIVSQWNHDADALAVTVPRLRDLGIAVLDLRSELR